MALNINNEYCTSFEQLSSYFITLPEFGSNLYLDLIESGRDQAISQWLHDNIGNVDMAHQLESIDDTLGDTDYLKEMRRIILGEKVLEDDSVQVIKPTFSSCFSLENVELEQTNEKNTVLISLKVLTPMVNENFELRLETGWGIQSWSINPFNSKVDEVLKHDFGFCKLFDQEFDCIRLYADNELLSEVSVQRRNRKTIIHGIKQDEPSMASYKKNPSSSFRYEYGMFQHSSLEEIDLNNLDTSNATALGYFMFYGCSSLAVLNLSGFETGKVTNMRGMFYGCSSLKALELSGFNTSNVTDIAEMFNGCSSLKALDLSSFDTSKVTNMCSMFNGYSSLKSLDLSNFDTSKVTNMSSMFEGCSSLEEIDLCSFDTSKVTNMSKMFNGCSSLKALDLSGFNTSNVTDIAEMFNGCSSLKALDLRSFDTSKVINMSRVLEGCSSLEEIDLCGFDTSKVYDISRMFYGCSSLKVLDLSGFNISKVTIMPRMFFGCSSLEELDLSCLRTLDSWAMNMDDIFFGCYSLRKLVIKGCNGFFADLIKYELKCSGLRNVEIVR